LTNLIKYLKRCPSVLVILALIISCIWVNGNVAKWNKKSVIDWDVTSYYSYLPAAFIKKDLTLKFFDEDPQFYILNKQYNPQKCPNGNYVIKTSMGMSVMYLPFFELAHIYAQMFGYPADGYSEPYQFMIQFSGLVYLVIGLYFLRRLLLLYFSEKVVAFTFLFVLFGSNLFYYASVQGAMSHAHTFCLACVFIWYSIKWLLKPDLKITIILGLTFGLIVLIRPVNILFILFPVFFGVTSLEGIKQRLFLFLKRMSLVLLMAALTFLVFLPQLVYWKYISGHYFFNSYIGEQFYFGHPHLIEGLFGFRKGWLLYSPIMIFSLIGIVILFKTKKEFSWPAAILFVIYTYVVLSWWCWWYGGSYGLRAMIDIYPFLIIAFAVFINKMILNKTVMSVLGILVLINCFQMYQYRRGVIHFDSMTKEAYMDALFRVKTSPNLEKLISPPDYEKARKGEE
jgi:hypothetical protein